MKTIINMLSLFFLLLLIGCDSFLDPEKDGKISEEEIWNQTRRAFGMLNNAYRQLPEGYNRIEGGMLAAACDEAAHSDVASNIKGFNNGTWGPTFIIEEVWTKNYEGIRKVNKFLERIYDLKIPEKQTTQGSQEELINTRERMIGEAHFLRAYFYFELVKRYGGVPLYTKTLTPEEATKAERATMEECIKQIIADCDTAFNRLPEVYQSTIPGFDDKKDMGRPTSVTTTALKSRVLLYWASPLNNSQYDLDRYKKAAEAAQEVISSNRYRLMVYREGTDVTDLYVTSTYFPEYHNEIIFSTRYNSSTDVEKNNTPLTMGGKGLTNPTQNLADMFGMANGKPITDLTSGYDKDNPYLNRDPRFYMSFAHNDMEFRTNDQTQPIETFIGGKDAAGSSSTATRTGYYLNKLLSNEAVWDGQTYNVNRTWVLMRYAEVLLNYAEAMNEYLPEPSDSIYTVLELIRSRAGLDPYRIERGKTQQEMREIIRNERAVELAFEEHRFFDIRRWRLLDNPVEREKYTDIYGIKITPTTTGYTYEKELVEKRVFDEKMYRYPIPQDEILRASGIKQNEGW